MVPPVKVNGVDAAACRHRATVSINAKVIHNSCPGNRHRLDWHAVQFAVTITPGGTRSGDS